MTAQSQVSCYAPSISNGTYSPISGGTRLGQGTLDDDGFNTSIGFTFSFNGINYTAIGVSANGYIQFGAVTPPAAPRAFIGTTLNLGVSALAKDLQGNSATSEIRVETIGSSPNRVCVIQWSDWGDWPQGSNTGDTYDFQIRLYESNYAIEVIYGNITADNAVSCDIGIKDASNNISAKSIANGTNTWATATNVVSNNVTSGGPMAALDASFKPASGLTYTWVKLNTLIAGFSAPDTVYAGQVLDFINNNQSGFNSAWDMNGDNATDFTSTNVTTYYPSAGIYKVRLISSNCGLVDSAKKTIIVINPSAQPIADFIASKNTLQIYESVTLSDLSLNGPSAWKWEVFDPSDSANTVVTDPVLIGNNPFVNRRPTISFLTAGSYKVCLTTANGLGSSNRVCKDNYITVTPIMDISMGAITSSTLTSGNLYDNGGPNSNYGNITNTNLFTIVPCGADSIKLKFSQFKFGAGEVLRVYDGFDANGKPLHSGNGFTSTNPPTGTLVAASGAMHLYFTSDASGVDSGFKASWSTVMGPMTPPVPSFIKPADTIYSLTPYTFINTSTNAKGAVNYGWSVNGALQSFSKDFTYSFPTPGSYEIQLDVTNCLGSMNDAQTVVVIHPTKQVSIDFTATNLRPAVNDNDTFSALTDFATNFSWAFYPNTVTYQAGTNQNSKNPIVKFNQPGPYHVTLTAWHSSNQGVTQRIVTKQDYLIAVKYCQPAVSNSSADIGITRVLLKSGNNTLIDNNTTVNMINGGYTNYSSMNADLTFGATYSITLERGTNVDPITRKVWIDFNIDGDFNDAGEMVAYDLPGTSTSYSANFTVPDITASFPGKTVMRVGVSYNNFPNTPCGPNTAGEYEDYPITLKADGGTTIALIGDDTVYAEQGSTYIDEGAVANDATEGDISSKIVTQSNVYTLVEGVYTVTYTVTDASGNKASVTRTVIVKYDVTAPVITLNGNSTVTLPVFTAYDEDSATAVDNKDGDLTSSVVITGAVNTNVTGSYTITYKVADSRGNTAVKTRTVIVKDMDKPEIHELLEDEVQVGSIFEEDEYIQVTDNYDLVITYNRSGDIVKPNVLGIYTVTYTAEDAAGNKADTVVRVYKVNDYIPPVIAFGFNTDDTLLVEVGSNFSNPKPVFITDNYYKTSELLPGVSGSVDPGTLGLYMLEYTAIDPSNNKATVIVWVRVVDTDPPTIDGSPLYVKLNTNYNPMAGLILDDNYYSADVLKPLVKITSYNVDIHNEGTYYITYIVSDPSGNVSAPFTRLVFVSEKYQATGIAKVEGKLNFLAYPNPASDKVTLTYDLKGSGQSVIEVYNTTGTRVFEAVIGEENSHETVLDVSAYAAGVYYVKLRSGNEVQTLKLVINK